MSRMTFQSAALDKLRGADLELLPGRYVVLGSEREPLRELVALAAGLVPPRSGHVRLDDGTPHAAPALRARLAALCDDESLPPARTTLQSVALVLAARGSAAGDASRILTDAGLSHWADTPVSLLDSRATRSIALALALAHDHAALLALHEPLTTALPRQYVLEALDRHTERGAIVLSTTTSSGDAMLLGGSWLCVELGRVRGATGPSPRLGAGPWQQVLIEVSDAQSLAQLLHASALGLATELGSEARQLKVTGPALEVTVRELIGLCRAHGIEVQRITPVVPPVEALLAARAGYARGAYEAARQAALGSAGASSYTNQPGGYT
jgi:ABC-type transport system involved in cytochrome c biogenesis ATPase subunit